MTAPRSPARCRSSWPKPTSPLWSSPTASWPGRSPAGALSRLPNLRYIDLSGNALSGPVPPGLLHGSFRFLILANNRLTGEIPAGYGDGDIDTVDLSRNQLTGDPAPFLFGTAKPMRKIDLSWNQLEFDMTRCKTGRERGCLS